MAFSRLAGNEESAVNHSSSLNSTFRRGDNRTFFARQGSESLAFFLRPSSEKQNHGQAILQNQELPSNCSGPEIGMSNKLSGVPMFSRPAQRSVWQELELALPYDGVPFHCYGSQNEKFCEPSGAPMFSRPFLRSSKLLNAGEHQFVKRERGLSATYPPKFARPHEGMIEQTQPRIQPRRNGTGTEWSPRTDIAVYGSHYVVTVELPGFISSDIRVELDNRNLIVTGKRSSQSGRMVRNASEDAGPTYLQKEIIQGPYQFVWPLPGDVDKNGASAEFVDGFLEISLPKLSLAKL